MVLITVRQRSEMTMMIATQGSLRPLLLGGRMIPTVDSPAAVDRSAVAGLPTIFNYFYNRGVL